MKRLNKTEWTDGKDIYVGSPKQGFRLKEPQEVVDSGPVELKPSEPQDIEDIAEPGND